MSETQEKIVSLAHSWRARLDDGLQESEEREFQAWMKSDPHHAQAFAEAEEYWWRAGQSEMIDAIQKRYRSQTAIGETIGAPINAPQVNPGALQALLGRVANTLLDVRFAGAALTVLTCVAVFVAFDGQSLLKSAPENYTQTFATEKGSRRVVTLPDRTRIEIGGASELTVNLSENKRSLALRKGSARFNVTRNARRPFVVSTDIASVQVTGTRFGVDLEDDAIGISVSEGSVRAFQAAVLAGRIQEASSIELTAGQSVRATLSGGFERITDFRPARSIERPTQKDLVSDIERLVYLRTPLSEVVLDINRHSAVPVRLGPGVGELEISGTFDSEQIDTLMRAIDTGSPVRIIDGQGERIIVLEQTE